MGARVSPSPAVTGCGSFLRNGAASTTGTAGGAPTGPWPALAPAHAWPLRRESRRLWPPPVRLTQPAQISAASLGNYRLPAAGAGRAQGPRPRDSQPPKESDLQPSDWNYAIGSPGSPAGGFILQILVLASLQIVLTSCGRFHMDVISEIGVSLLLGRVRSFEEPEDTTEALNQPTLKPIPTPHFLFCDIIHFCYLRLNVS
ncbi:PREDICTED: uncharacterized protein LOC105593099 [Cercocebus atys]|uniref:uncharacterized protein LOC105593099 n=1 Tax=Cercocebus atys TaxID=9531 RepID=UPI0005F4B7C7|nr:PREDICTED: uncharacterized protein LOC105593099 [Cercocebus atys]